MLKQILRYFLVYKKYIGTRVYLVFVLSALAAFTEGIGIVMLLPLITAAGIDSDRLDVVEPAGMQAGLQSVLQRLGVAESIVGILLLIGALFLIKGAIVFLSEAYRSHLQARLNRDLTSLMFRQYGTMDYAYYSKRNTGHFVNIVSMQIRTMVMSFAHFKQCMTIMIAAAAYVGMAFLIAWQFALMAVAAGLFLLLIFRGLNNYVHDLSRRSAHEQSVLNKFLVQTLQSFKYLVSTAQLRPLENAVMRSIHKLTGYIRRQGIAQALSLAMGEPVAILFVLLVVMIQVVVLEAPLAPIFVALALFNRAMSSMLGMQQAWQLTLKQIGSLEIVEKEFEEVARHQQSSGHHEIKPFHRSLELRQVGFAFDARSAEVLSDVSMVIPVNTTVAIVGPSGAGKSTLVDLLTLLLRPTRGEVLIDGVPGGEIESASWRSQIGYVSQETVVFDDTIANNICLWNEDDERDAGARERIEHAARQAFADRFVQEMPEGYRTLVGDRGVRLSGGQRQRLFLARELYKQPRFLILDEATSALDSESEQYIRKSIDRLRGRVTVVLIAHRLSTVRHADCIYVLENGRLVEQGSFETLMSKPQGRFQRMARMQNL